MQTAPVVIIPCSSKAAYLHRYAEEDKGWTDEDEARWPVPFWHMDAAMASLLILLTAVDEGLGACFFGIPPQYDGATREAFGIPGDFDPVGAITLGHRRDDEQPSGSPTSKKRRPLDELRPPGPLDVLTRGLSRPPVQRSGPVRSTSTPGAPVSDPRVLGSSGRQGACRSVASPSPSSPSSPPPASGVSPPATPPRPTGGSGSRPGLRRPPAFGPVWTLLYTGIAVAGWRLYDAGSPRTKRLHLTQLALNAAWPAAFFGAGEKKISLARHRRARRPRRGRGRGRPPRGPDLGGPAHAVPGLDRLRHRPQRLGQRARLIRSPGRVPDAPRQSAGSGTRPH